MEQKWTGWVLIIDAGRVRDPSVLIELDVPRRQTLKLRRKAFFSDDQHEGQVTSRGAALSGGVGTGLHGDVWLL